MAKKKVSTRERKRRHEQSMEQWEKDNPLLAYRRDQITADTFSWRERCVIRWYER